MSVLQILLMHISVPNQYSECEPACSALILHIEF